MVSNNPPVKSTGETPVKGFAFSTLSNTGSFKHITTDKGTGTDQYLGIVNFNTTDKIDRP